MHLVQTNNNSPPKGADVNQQLQLEIPGPKGPFPVVFVLRDSSHPHRRPRLVEGIDQFPIESKMHNANFPQMYQQPQQPIHQQMQPLSSPMISGDDADHNQRPISWFSSQGGPVVLQPEIHTKAEYIDKWLTWNWGNNQPEQEISMDFQQSQSQPQPVNSFLPPSYPVMMTQEDAFYWRNQHILGQPWNHGVHAFPVYAAGPPPPQLPQLQPQPHQYGNRVNHPHPRESYGYHDDYNSSRRGRNQNQYDYGPNQHFSNDPNEYTQQRRGGWSRKKKNKKGGKQGPPQDPRMTNMNQNQRNFVSKVPQPQNPPQRLRKPDTNCRFCKNHPAPESAEYAKTHVLRDEEGRITCPILREFVCTICNATGDSAHTYRYCPIVLSRKGGGSGRGQSTFLPPRNEIFQGTSNSLFGNVPINRPQAIPCMPRQMTF